MSDDPLTIPALFIRLQQLRESCWRAHIRKDREGALQQAALLEQMARRLKEALQ